MPRFASVALRMALFGGLILTAGAAFAQDKVGVSSAVNPEASGTAPGSTTRRLVIGQEVVYNERISTGASGQTQLLFLDESSMTIGPNSDLTIDQFVFDPKSGTGKLAMSATRGLLRYVGGKLSKQDEAVTLRTNTATLAVRGGAFIVDIDTGGTTHAVFIYGNGLTVTGANGGAQTVTRPGFQTTVSRGGSPTPPGPQPPGQLAQYLQELDGRTGGSGGATTIPTDASVSSSGISNTVSGNINQSNQQAQQNQVGNTGNRTNGLGSPNTGTQGQNFVQQPNNAITCATGDISCSSSSTTKVLASNSPSSGNGNPSGGNNPPAQTTSFTYAGRVKNTNGNGTTRGFVDQSTNGDSPYPNSPSFSNGTLSFAPGSPQNGVFTGTFGNLGTLTFPLIPGSSTFTNGMSSTLGSFSGTSFLSADNTFFYASITLANQPTERLFVSGGTPVNSSFYPQTGSTRIFAFSVQPDAALQSNIPFIRSQAGGNLPNAAVSPLYAVAPPTTPIGDSSTVSAARALQASLAINGQGANQQSAIAVTTGTFSTSTVTNQPILAGALRGSSQLSANGTPVRLSSAVTSAVDGNGNSFYGTNSISGFVLNQTAYNGNSANGTVGTAIVPSTASEVQLSGGATNYGFAQPAIPVAVPTGVGAARSTQALSGNFGGLMYSTAQATPYILTGGSLITTDASNNRVQATLAGSAQSPSSGVNTVSMQYGGLTGDAGGRQAFVDNSTFAALESQTNAQQVNGQNLVVNGDSTQAGKLYLLSSGTVAQPTQLLPSGTSFCQCQYLQWGYWGGDLQTGNSANATVSRVDRGHINTWVAGVPTPLGDLNNLVTQSATASYTGAAIGSVYNNGASYIAAGGFNGTYNFGTQSGTMALTNFDGHNFSATGRAPLNGANYAFSVSSPGVSGAINGTFYGPAAAETGGSFAVQTTVGPSYLASGTFAGKR